MNIKKSFQYIIIKENNKGNNKLNVNPYTPQKLICQLE